MWIDMWIYIYIIYRYYDLIWFNYSFNDASSLPHAWPWQQRHSGPSSEQHEHQPVASGKRTPDEPEERTVAVEQPKPE